MRRMISQAITPTSTNGHSKNATQINRSTPPCKNDTMIFEAEFTVLPGFQRGVGVGVRVAVGVGRCGLSKTVIVENKPSVLHRTSSGLSLARSALPGRKACR